jgi:hypothetical protein
MIKKSIFYVLPTDNLVARFVRNRIDKTIGNTKNVFKEKQLTKENYEILENIKIAMDYIGVKMIKILEPIFNIIKDKESIMYKELNDKYKKILEKIENSTTMFKNKYEFLPTVLFLSKSDYQFLLFFLYDIKNETDNITYFKGLKVKIDNELEENDCYVALL